MRQRNCQLDFLHKCIIFSKGAEQIMVEANFDFLKNDHLLGDQYQNTAKIAKLYEIEDYRDVMVNARLVLEDVIKKIFSWENLNQYYVVPNGDRRTLRSDTFYLQSELDYPLNIFNLMNEIRRMGNDAVHDPHYQPTKGQAWHCICALNDVLVFLLNSYEAKKLNYLRPDIMLDAIDNKQQQYRQRQLKNMPKENDNETIKNDNLKQAHEFLQHKKKKRFGKRLRKLFKH